jgi:arylsulfatase A-like enzyme
MLEGHGVSWRSGRVKLAVAALLAFAIPLVLVACTRTVTHEPDSIDYDQVQQTSPNATWTNGNEIPAYEGSYEGKANYVSGGASSHARGLINVNVPNGYDGYYGAAFYFPSGTFNPPTGSNQTDQNGDIDIMGWSNSAGHYGGIRIGPDHKARLVRGTSSGSPDTIGSAFPVREGCWNWVAVHQRLGQTNATNQVYVNGRKVVDSTSANNFGADAAQVRFGLVSAGSNQTRPLHFYVDESYVSQSDLLTPRSTACQPPPNVLFIVSDDQRFGTLGGTPPWMPETRKRFRDQGTVFQNAEVTTSLCCPSRSSILTGRYAHNHGVKRNTEAGNLDPGDPATTLEHYLHDKASPQYLTGVFGKYLNRWNLNQNPAEFDRWSIYNNGKHYPDPAAPCFSSADPNQGVSCVNQDGSLTRPPATKYETNYVADRVKNFIDQSEQDDARPWFMYVTPTLPHSPFTQTEVQDDSAQGGPNYRDDVPPPFVRNPNFMEQGDNYDRTDKPPYVQNIALAPCDPNIPTVPPCDPSAPTGIETGTYPGQMRLLKSVDDLVKSIFDKLDATGEAQNTLAFFISDNGFLWGEHGLSAKTHSYAYSVRVPMFLRWPGHNLVAPPAPDERLAANIDLAPTVMKAVGISPDPGKPMDGWDLLSSSPSQQRDHWLLENWLNTPPAAGQPPAYGNNNVPAWASRRSLTSQYTEYYLDDGTSVRPTDPYRWRPGDRFAGAPVREYYNLTADGWQLTNRLGDADLTNDPLPGDVATWSSQLAADRQCAGHGELMPMKPPCP